jgi:hypothetical protein
MDKMHIKLYPVIIPTNGARHFYTKIQAIFYP